MEEKEEASSSPSTFPVPSVAPASNNSDAIMTSAALKGTAVDAETVCAEANVAATVDNDDATIVTAHDRQNALFEFSTTQLRKQSAVFWDKWVLVEEHWLRCVQGLNDTVEWREERSRRLSLVELVVQTPQLVFVDQQSRCRGGVGVEGGQGRLENYGEGEGYRGRDINDRRWFALLQFRDASSSALFFVPPECYRKGQPTEYGYAPSSVLEKAIGLLYRSQGEELLHRDLTFLWTLQASEGNLSPAVAARFERMTTAVLPDDRLIWELWSPGIHPTVKRGLQVLHFAVASIASDSSACVRALATCHVRCKTATQDAFVKQCRGCIKEEPASTPFAETAVEIACATRKWHCKWRQRVPLTFTDGKTSYEAEHHRIRWLAVWGACLNTFGFQQVLSRTPDSIIKAFVSH